MMLEKSWEAQGKGDKAERAALGSYSQRASLNNEHLPLQHSHLSAGDASLSNLETLV